MSIVVTGVKARQILDSRGNPTLEVEMTSKNGLTSRAAVPSGASTGAFEAHELRDGDKTKFLGKGVLKAKDNAFKLFDKFKGQAFDTFGEFDSWLLNAEGTKNKSNYGANALLGLSLAFSKLEAMEKNVSYYELFHKGGDYRLPLPLMNVLNGGAHSNNGLDIQEFMVVPKCGETFFDAVRAGAEIFQHLKKILAAKGKSVAVGDEGGFAPELGSNFEALDLLMEAIKEAGYIPGKEIFLAMDVAATEFYDEAAKKYKFEGKDLSSEEMSNVYKEMIEKYPIISIEDGFSEEDWSGWANAQAAYGDKIQLVGDDLFVTNVERIKRGLEEKSANALLVKPNQIGTVTETIKAVELMHGSDFKTVMSHRSGETEDVSISHLCVGLDCSQIKTGSLCRGERTAKYNELIRIAEDLPADTWKKSLSYFQ
ncbi:MAG: phosphopyruvate hydratase [Bdellovibrionales bacterium]